jgi:YegS/Rv2252/BmrU family lipid kinase
MKHIFIINPKAGKKDVSDFLTKEIAKYLNEGEYEIYQTKGVLDARDYVKAYCESHQGESLRFYSCGGDGTLNEVANGIYGFKNVSFTCYPSGSGNDFIKYFGKREDFLNIPNLISGTDVTVDLLSLGNRFVVNICNMGFDGDAALRMIKYRRLPFVSGKMSYILGVMVSFLKKLPRKLKVTVDGNVIFEGEGLLGAMANAICYGGGFYCTPRASVTDGLIDLIVVKKISRMKFINLIKYYKNGTHLDNPKLKPYILYQQGKSITIESDQPLNYSVDGELDSARKISISIVPLAVNFTVPTNLVSNEAFSS